MRLKDITGQRFCSLVIMYRIPQNTRFHAAMWMCRCDCGKRKACRGTAIRRGHHMSCGEPGCKVRHSNKQVAQ